MTSAARAKGYRTVAKGKEIFYANGYLYANLEKTGKFVKEKDLFGLWDYLFIKDRLHVFVQFKTNEGFGVKRHRKWLAPFIYFGRKHESRNVKYQIWNWIDNKGFEVLECSKKVKQYKVNNNDRI